MDRTGLLRRRVRTNMSAPILRRGADAAIFESATHEDANSDAQGGVRRTGGPCPRTTVVVRPKRALPNVLNVALLLAIVAPMAMSPGPAFAAPASVWSAQPLPVLDPDSVEGAAPDFALLDSDGDGAVDRSEFEAWFATDDPDVDAFAFFDLDADGRISADEFDAMAFEAPEDGNDAGQVAR